jgi:6-phosphogluconolactonase
MRAITAFDTRDGLMAAAARRVSEALVSGVQARGSACAALSGGLTPEPAYRLLAAEAVDWPRVTFALVDERFVPPDHPFSNEGMLRRSLGRAIGRGAAVAPMFAPERRLEEAADLADAAYAPLHFDIALLGMGADGHTASWFPRASGLADAIDPTSSRTVVAVRAVQAAGASERLTLTLAAISRADRVLLVITGDEKRSLLERAVDEPVAALFNWLPRPPEVLWAP